MYSYIAYGLNIFSEIKLPELSEAKTAADYDLHIHVAQFEFPRLKATQIYRRGIKADFGKDQEENLYLHWENVAGFKANSGKFLTVMPFCEDANLLSLFTVSEALGLILFQKNYFLLHASAVQVGDEAWCFMGAPGAGKSTTAAAFIKAGCKLLSDDLTAIAFNNNFPVVIPAYPQLKIWNNTVKGLDYQEAELQPVSEGINKFSYQPKSGFSHDPVKLGQVFFLHKARNRKALQSLTAPEIPTEMLKNFPLPVQLLVNEALKRHFLQSFQCAGAAQMWRKRRPDGFNNLEKWVLESIPEPLIAV